MGLIYGGLLGLVSIVGPDVGDAATVKKGPETREVGFWGLSREVPVGFAAEGEIGGEEEEEVVVRWLVEGRKGGAPRVFTGEPERGE